MTEPINPRHNEVRSVLRVLGPSIAAIGALFLLVGMASFFASFGSYEPPRLFWCAFVGMPLLFVGTVISKFAYLGAVMRYAAGEAAPVSKDVTNYMVDGTKGAIRDAATAIGEGLGIARPSQANSCAKCGTENEASANYCRDCGAPLAQTKHCQKCGDANDGDARFCENCGTAFG